MKRLFTLLAAMLFVAFTSNATHIVGGEFNVRWTSGTTFHVTLNFYRDCASGNADFDDPITVGIYDKVTNVNQQCFSMSLTSRTVLSLGDACYKPSVCVERGVYEANVNIPSNANGYYMTYNRCCRNNIITNIQNPGGTGEAWYVEIPDPALHNSTPVFGGYPKGYFCTNNINVQDFSATDPDGDSLVYSLITPLAGHTSSSNSIGSCPDPAPYPFVTWAAGYSAANMVGGNPAMSITSQNGILTAKPAVIGTFVFCVRVEQYNRTTKQKLGEIRRDIQYSSLACTVAAAYPDTIVCPNTPVPLHASGGTSYSWSPATGLSSTTSPNPTATVSVTTTYTVSVTSGTCTSTATVTVHINPNISVIITPAGPTTFCDGGSVILTASGAANYNWSPNGETTASISVNSSDNYSVVGTSGGCVGNASQVVTVNPNPAVVLTPNGPTTFCDGGSVTIVATGADEYKWGDNTTNPTIVVSKSGKYTVTGTSKGCTGTASIDVTVNPIPSIGITAGGPTTFCAGGSVKLTATGGTTYKWSPSNSTATTITAKSTGTYTVTGTSLGCSATAVQQVVANPLPKITISPNGPVTFCEGGSVTLTASGALTYKWITGETTNSIVVTGSRTVYAVGTDANGCSAVSNIITVTMNRRPTITITPGGPTTFCDGGTVQLCASGAATYMWSPGNIQGACINATKDGQYTVIGTSVNECAANASITITVKPMPVVTITADGPTNFCPGGSVVLTAHGATEYQWTPGGENTNAITVDSTGSFNVTGTTNGCSASAVPVDVKLNPPIVVSITPDGPTTYCEGGSVGLCATAGASYKWSPGNETTQCITVANPNNYSVLVTSSEGCTGTNNISTVVNPLPVVNIVPQGPTTFCQGESVQLCADNGVEFSWNLNGGAAQCTNVSTGGDYVVSIKDNNGCAGVSLPLTVTVIQLPTVTASVNGVINCLVNKVTISANNCTASSFMYSWDGPGGYSSASQCPLVSVAGHYTVTANNEGCLASDAVTVMSDLTPPDLKITGGEINCVTPVVTLNAETKVTNPSFSWTGPNGFASVLQNPTISDSGTYTVVVTDNANGCTSTESTHVNKVMLHTSGACGQDGIITDGFELDGNATAVLPDKPDDWDLVYNGTSNADYIGFNTDNVSNADNYFYTGSKDNIDLSNWRWNINSTPDKDDILHSGIAIYGNLAYFFVDRYAVPGNSQVGIWLLQGNVRPENDGTFSGSHVFGDLLIILNFTNGSAVPVMTAYEWVGSGGSDGVLNKVTMTSVNAFVVTNSSIVPSPWPYKPKFGADNQFAPGAFIEGGVDMACMDASAAFSSCFPSFMVETRASNSVGAELKDFIWGELVPNPNKGHREVPQQAKSDQNILMRAYPNPFKAVSTIEFERTIDAGHMKVEVFTLTGDKVATLFDKDADANVLYKAEFDGSNLPAGIYIYKVTGGDKVLNGKLVLMK